MAETLRLLIDTLDTPTGELAIVADRQGNLRSLERTDHDERMRRLLRLHYGAAGFVLEPARDPSGLTRALRAYFAGDLSAIDRLPVATGGTPFQRTVWRRQSDRCRRALPPRHRLRRYLDRLRRRHRAQTLAARA